MNSTAHFSCNFEDNYFRTRETHDILTVSGPFLKAQFVIVSMRNGRKHWTDTTLSHTRLITSHTKIILVRHSVPFVSYIFFSFRASILLNKQVNKTCMYSVSEFDRSFSSCLNDKMSIKNINLREFHETLKAEYKVNQSMTNIYTNISVHLTQLLTLESFAKL